MVKLELRGAERALLVPQHDLRPGGALEYERAKGAAPAVTGARGRGGTTSWSAARPFRKLSSKRGDRSDRRSVRPPASLRRAARAGLSEKRRHRTRRSDRRGDRWCSKTGAARRPLAPRTYADVLDFDMVERADEPGSRSRPRVPCACCAGRDGWDDGNTRIVVVSCRSTCLCLAAARRPPGTASWSAYVARHLWAAAMDGHATVAAPGRRRRPVQRTRSRIPGGAMLMSSGEGPLRHRRRYLYARVSPGQRGGTTRYVEIDAATENAQLAVGPITAFLEWLHGYPAVLGPPAVPRRRAGGCSPYPHAHRA